MKKKIITYLLLLNISYIFFGVIWGNHVHHNNTIPINPCSNYEFKINSKAYENCLKYGISESVFEHLFENGVVYKNTINKSFNKFKNILSDFLFFQAENYKISNNVAALFYKTVVDYHVDTFILDVISPRPPPFFS